MGRRDAMRTPEAFGQRPLAPWHRGEIEGKPTMHGMHALTRSRPAVAAAVVVAAGGAATILGAYFFQYVVGLQPCPLCLDQRIAFYVSIPLAVAVAVAQVYVNCTPRRVQLAFRSWRGRILSRVPAAAAADLANRTGATAFHGFHQATVHSDEPPSPRL